VGNRTMDMKSSWCEINQDAIQAALSRGCNIQLFSDGGFRRGYDAAAAWMMRTAEIREGGWTFAVVAQAGVNICLDSTCSSFRAETVALESMMDAVVPILT